MCQSRTGGQESRRAGEEGTAHQAVVQVGVAEVVRQEHVNGWLATGLSGEVRSRQRPGPRAAAETTQLATGEDKEGRSAMRGEASVHSHGGAESQN